MNDCVGGHVEMFVGRGNNAQLFPLHLIRPGIIFFFEVNTNKSYLYRFYLFYGNFYGTPSN